MSGGRGNGRDFDMEDGLFPQAGTAGGACSRAAVQTEIKPAPPACDTQAGGALVRSIMVR